MKVGIAMYDVTNVAFVKVMKVSYPVGSRVSNVMVKEEYVSNL